MENKKILNACSLIYSVLCNGITRGDIGEKRTSWGCIEFPVGNSGEGSGLNINLGVVSVQVIVEEMGANNHTCRKTYRVGIECQTEESYPGIRKKKMDLKWERMK